MGRKEVLVALERRPKGNPEFLGWMRTEFTTHQEPEIPNSTSSASSVEGEGRVTAGQGASPS